MSSPATTAPTGPGTLEHPVDGDPRVPWRAGPLLGTFARSGVLTSADVRTAERLGRLTGEPDESVQLAAALTVRALRAGSVCLDLTTVRTLVAEDVADEARLDDPARPAIPGPDTPRPDSTGPDDAGPDTDDDALPWPDLDAWRATLRRSPLVADGPGGPVDRPVRLVGDLLYLDRSWRDEQTVRAEVTARLAAPLPVAPEALDAALARCFPEASDDAQRDAARTAARSRLTVLTGGPGTGKTTTVARLVATLQLLTSTAEGTGGTAPLRVAFCAPTGKASTRLQESIDAQLGELGPDLPLGPVRATTIHSLLRTVPGSTTRFRHGRAHRLPHDVVVVDEASMVSLPLLARVLEALRPDARLVLVGDHHQLASVEVGAVLGDLVTWLRPTPKAVGATTAAVEPGEHPTAQQTARPTPRSCVVELTVRHRFGAQLGALADAINAGNSDLTLELLRAGGEHVEFVELTSDAALLGVHGDDFATLRHDVTDAGTRMVEAARAADGVAALRALGGHRLLLAHRRGPAGVARWASLAQGWVADATGHVEHGAWPLGRPLLVTTNDRTTGLSNGDTGVVIADGDGGVTVVLGDPDAVRRVPPHRLPPVEPVYAMTVHRAQGSQFAHVSVVLPPPGSPLLTRELLYTAVTRAQDLVRVVGTADAVRAAVARHVRRASGLTVHP